MLYEGTHDLSLQLSPAHREPWFIYRYTYIMRYIDRLNRAISKYDADDYDKLFDFFREVWPDNSYHQSVRYWEWQFPGNPNSPEGNPQIWLFKREGKILGQLATVPVVLKAGDLYCNCSWGIDLMVKSEYRSKGIGFILTKEWSKNTEISLALGISDQAYSMYKTDEWIDLGDLPRFVKVLDSRSYVSKHFRFPPIVFMLSTVINFLLRLYDSMFIEAAKNGCDIINVDRFNEDIDELWERASKQIPVIVRRDSKYLNWRYVDRTDVDYKIFQIINGDETYGYMVLRFVWERDIRTGCIVDFLCMPDKIGFLISKAIQYFRDEGAEVVTCYLSGVRFGRELQRFGFLRRLGERFMIKINNPHLNQELLKDRAKWFVTKGDSDIDRV